MHSYLVDRFGDLEIGLDRMDARLEMSFAVGSATAICTQCPLNLHYFRMLVNGMHLNQERTAGTVSQVSSRQNCSFLCMCRSSRYLISISAVGVLHHLHDDVLLEWKIRKRRETFTSGIHYQASDLGTKSMASSALKKCTCQTHGGKHCRNTDDVVRKLSSKKTLGL